MTKPPRHPATKTWQTGGGSEIRAVMKCQNWNFGLTEHRDTGPAGNVLDLVPVTRFGDAVHGLLPAKTPRRGSGG